MKRNADDSNPVMIGQTDWYAEAGKRPFIEDGFTPELMMRIEQAAVNKNSGYKRYWMNKNVLLTSLATVLLIGALTLPMGVWKNTGPIHSPSVQSQGAGILPSSSSATNDKALEPPTSPVEFEISGKKYYMPLPMNRDKSKAYAVETTAGILWSPPPPMVDYKKPKYTHPTEPFTLYLSSKDQTELSASSATRIYTFPLYGGGASTYQYLSGFFGAGDYVLLISFKMTLGVGMYEDVKFSMLNVKKAAAGESVVPIALASFDNTLLEYKSLIAVDKEHGQLVLSYLEYAGDKKYKEKTVLYDMETMSIPTPATAIGFKEIKGETLIMDYKVGGEQRKADILTKAGLGWLDENWAFLSEEQQNKLYMDYMNNTP
ncbi:hypothetical protein BSK66_21645 [Paenibacillus odorifer]|uniref:hypothetical protein n=1 Tax=Paenibacillus TaxID=44249 RepID=UPI0003E2A832|nr:MULTISPECIES: hypothetical protein [Paenibacillus]ETT67240.1 hypothetical protein C171_04755 [Paenibacillus sp. FSL H8-237]OMD16190.1 hypothetical protein BJP47_21245 [Paenibacillus odorifer]OMD29735.1 hypothetical protein BJP48_16765 [Paenibacillus odorifer]OME51920.1 hypothetical protein BSK61_19615 [Paenibacillus odorifer]OME52617.1 hypothetical protein BSK66_21645 [Paenibacillus odorifer]